MESAEAIFLFLRFIPLEYSSAPAPQSNTPQRCALYARIAIFFDYSSHLRPPNSVVNWQPHLLIPIGSRSPKCMNVGLMRGMPACGMMPRSTPFGCTARRNTGLYPEPSGLKITLIGERLAQIDVLPFSIPTSVGTAMSCPEAEVIH